MSWDHRNFNFEAFNRQLEAMIQKQRKETFLAVIVRNKGEY